MTFLKVKKFMPDQKRGCRSPSQDANHQTKAFMKQMVRSYGLIQGEAGNRGSWIMGRVTQMFKMGKWMSNHSQMPGARG